MSLETKRPPFAAYVSLVLVVFAAAAAPIAIRRAQLEGVPSLYIIAARLLIASFVLGPPVVRRYGRDIQQLARRDWFFVLAAGATHAFGLSLLFFALEYTSVLINTALRRTSPLWVVSLEMALLSVVFTRRMWVGIVVTVAGGVIVALGSTAAGGGSNHLVGAVLSLLNAVTIGLYLLIGRQLRDKLPLLAYSWLVFTSAALFVLLAVFMLSIPLTGYSASGYLWILIVTVVAQFMGHIPIHQTVRHFSATYVSTAMQLSVALAAVFALFLLREVPSPSQIAGSALIVAGVMLVSQG